MNPLLSGERKQRKITMKYREYETYGSRKIGKYVNMIK